MPEDRNAKDSQIAVDSWNSAKVVLADEEGRTFMP